MDRFQNLTFARLQDRAALTAGMAASIAIGALMLGILFYFDAHSQVLRLLKWIDSLGVLGPVTFSGIMALVVVLLLPGIVFTMGAGFLFGTVTGGLCVLAGTTLGATAAFLSARFCFQSRTARFLKKHDTFSRFNALLEDKGWRVVMLTRMIPLFPFKASNYLFGITGLSYLDFVTGTIIGIIPATLVNVYAGSLVGDVAALETRAMNRTALEWALYGAGLIALIALVAVIGRRAHAHINKPMHTDAG